MILLDGMEIIVIYTQATDYQILIRLIDHLKFFYDLKFLLILIETKEQLSIIYLI